MLAIYSVQRVLSSTFTTKGLAWSSDDALPSASALGAFLGVMPSRLCCIEMDPAAQTLRYGLSEYILQCADPCEHQGVCLIRAGERGCDCTGTGRCRPYFSTHSPKACVSTPATL